MAQLRRRLARAGRRLLGRSDPVILMYHRVASVRVDPWELAVHPDHFAAQMRLLAETRNAVPLDWLVDELMAGRRPSGAVAVTFDDAYRDVLLNARPILESLGIPATVFVVTGLLGSQEGFWWDRLGEAVFGATPFPDSVEFPFLPADQAAGMKGEIRDGDVVAVHRRLWRHMRTLQPEVRERTMEDVSTSLGRPHGVDAPVMSPEDILDFTAGEGFTIGAHTVSHPSLPSLPEAEQHAELSGSRRYLEDLTGAPVERFAYPFGEFDERSRRLAAAVGFRYAVGVDTGTVRDPRSLFHLPRVDVKNWTGVEFADRLRWLA